MRELGALRVYLTTGAENVPAVQLYLGMGFRPEMTSSEEHAVWRGLAERVEPRFRVLLLRLFS
jgi:RimJ/RimL family protein N-acetyltransferase